MIASDASKELEALAAPPHMPDIPDADAKKLVLRMYYLELSKGVSLKDAQTKVGKITPMHCWQSQLLIGFFDWGFFLHQRLPYWWRLLSPTKRQPTGRSLLFLVMKRIDFGSDQHNHFQSCLAMTSLTNDIHFNMSAVFQPYDLKRL